VLLRLRYSDRNPGEVTGYAVALPGNTASDEEPVWYGGGKLAPDLTVPKLRRRWRQPTASPPVSAESARVFLRSAVCSAAEHARNETGYFTALEHSGILIRYYRSDEGDPGRITGYAVSLPGQHWVGGGRLGDNLTIGRLLQRWTAPDDSIRPPVTAAERHAIWDNVIAVTSQAARRFSDQVRTDPDTAADSAWATADLLRATGRAVRGPAARDMRRAADDFDRAAREANRVVPRRTKDGDILRFAARFLAATNAAHSPAVRQAALLVRMLAELADATAELREARQRAPGRRCASRSRTLAAAQPTASRRTRVPRKPLSQPRTCPTTDASSRIHAQPRSRGKTPSSLFRPNVVTFTVPYP
jgi:hypothetical protein